MSFDGAGAWLNPHIHGESVATRGKWYHIDQFYGKTPHRKGFQGLVTLYEADHDTGSFVCLPGSHRDYERNCRGRNPLGNFVRMSGKKDADYCAYGASSAGRALDLVDLHAIDDLMACVCLYRSTELIDGYTGRLPYCGRSARRHVSLQPPLARLVAYVACARNVSIRPAKADPLGIVPRRGDAAPGRDVATRGRRSPT